MFVNIKFMENISTQCLQYQVCVRVYQYNCLQYQVYVKIYKMYQHIVYSIKCA